MNLILILISTWTMTDPGFCVGYDAVVQNPAALVFPGNPKASLEYFGVRLHLNSNGFTIADYQRYFEHPVFLTEEDEKRILSSIGAGPLRIGTGSLFEILHGQYRTFGWGLDFEKIAVQSLPKALFELAFEGNEMNRTYQLGGLGFDTLSFMRLTAGGGFPVHDRFGLGVTVSWLRGMRYTMTASSSGELLTTPYVITGSTVQVRNVADGGDGFGITMGSALKFGESWRLGLSMRDLIAGIWWSENPGVRRVCIDLDSLNGYRYYQKPVLDSFLVKRDFFQSGGTIWTRLPGVIALGLGYTIAMLKLGAIVNLPLSWSPFISESPIGGVKFELEPLSCVGFTGMAAWHRQQGWSVALSTVGFYKGLEFSIGTEFRGHRLSAVKNAAMLFRIGYEF